MNYEEQPIVFDNLSPEEVLQFINGLNDPAYGRFTPKGVYLGGPVTEFLEDNPSYAVQWRQAFQSNLAEIAQGVFKIYDPTEGTWSQNELKFEKAEYNQLRYTDHYILDNCTEKIRKSDILVFNFLESSYQTPGTFWEIGLAFGLPNKYIIVVDRPDGLAANHPLIKNSCNFIFESLFDAAMACKYISEK